MTPEHTHHDGNSFQIDIPEIFDEPAIVLHSIPGSSRVFTAAIIGGRPLPISIYNTPASIEAVPGSKSSKSAKFLKKHGVHQIKAVLISVQFLSQSGERKAYCSAWYHRAYVNDTFQWRLVAVFCGVNQFAQRAIDEEDTFVDGILGTRD